MVLATLWPLMELARRALLAMQGVDSEGLLQDEPTVQRTIGLALFMALVAVITLMSAARMYRSVENHEGATSPARLLIALFVTFALSLVTVTGLISSSDPDLFSRPIIAPDEGDAAPVAEPAPTPIETSNNEVAPTPERTKIPRVNFSLELGSEDEFRNDLAFRFERSAGASTNDQRIKAVSTLYGEPQPARIALIPENEGLPTINVPLGGTVRFDPFETCRKVKSCAVGYVGTLRLRNPSEPPGYVNTIVQLSTNQKGVRILAGGVTFESSPVHVTKVLEGVSKVGSAVNYTGTIVHYDRIPDGAQIEIEGLLEARLLSPAPNDPISVEALTTRLVLTQEHPGGRATVTYMDPCKKPCFTWIPDDYGFGTVSIGFSSLYRGDVDVEWRMTVRMRLLNLKAVPDGVDLRLQTR